MLDGIAFLAGLESIGQSVSGKRVLLIGAGGAARAIALALVHAGISSIALINRTPARAAELAGRLRELAAEVEVVEHLQDRHYDLVVNASSQGMQPGDDSPVSVEVLTQETVVSDIVVGTRRTALVAAAERRGLIVQNGDAMLAAQIPLIADFLLGVSRPTAGEVSLAP
jgi:shikimate dehydrogenase